MDGFFKSAGKYAKIQDMGFVYLFQTAQYQIAIDASCFLGLFLNMSPIFFAISATL